MNFNDFDVEELELKLLELEKSSLKEDKKLYKEIDLYLSSLDNLRYEKKCYNLGHNLIAGVDEVGRGPLVGPVVAACVILPKNYVLEGLTDSKKLSEKKREYFYDIIMKDAISVGIGVVDNNIIDEINIYEATKMAMISAIDNLNVSPDIVLTDAMKLDIDKPVIPIIKGDLKSITISAASVIAKVTRDRMLVLLDKDFPFYNFKKNKGYPTKDHIAAIKKYGILKEHRKSYAPIKDGKYSIIN
jgi:ribonuclease HII